MIERLSELERRVFGEDFVGATELGFIASGIATWYYRTELSLVLAWTIGTAAVAAIIIASLLRGKLD